MPTGLWAPSALDICSPCTKPSSCCSRWWLHHCCCWELHPPSGGAPFGPATCAEYDPTECEWQSPDDVWEVCFNHPDEVEAYFRRKREARNAKARARRGKKRAAGAARGKRAKRGTHAKRGTRA